MAGKTTSKPETVSQSQHEAALKRIRDLEEKVGNLEAAVTSALGLSLTPPEPEPSDTEE